MNELTFEDFSRLKKEEQLNTLREEYKYSKANEGELKICNLILCHQLNKKQLQLIFQADRIFFSTNVRKLLDICEEKFNNDLPVSDIKESDLKDLGVITLFQSIIEINASEDMLVEYLNLATLEWARNKFYDLRTVPTIESALVNMDNMIKSIEGTVSSTKYYNISDDIMSMFEYYDSDTKVIKTGIKSFDSWFLLEPSDFCLVAGESGTGKTTFSINLIDGLVNNGNRGIFFSLEMNNIHFYLITLFRMTICTHSTNIIFYFFNTNHLLPPIIKLLHWFIKQQFIFTFSTISVFRYIYRYSFYIFFIIFFKF